MTERQIFRLIMKTLLWAAFIVSVILIALRLIHLLVLVFGAVVIAVLLRALADLIARHTPLARNGALAVALLAIVGTLTLLGWAFGAQIRGEFSQLIDMLPAAVESARARVLTLPGGEAVVATLENGNWLGRDVLPRLSSLVFSATGALLNTVLVIAGGIYIAADPRLYRRGLVLLVPKARREVVDEALGASAAALRRWMLGQLVSMLLIGIATWIGLWMVGVPSAPALGVIAGLLEIIPFAGPILAAVPILVIAFAESPETALMAALVVLVVQQLEGNLVTPFVQRRAVALPQALTVFGVVAGGTLFGAVGLLFAAPLLVVVYVLVQRLYVEEALHTPLESTDSEP